MDEYAISATQLYDELRSATPIYLLDLRIPSEFDEWKIEGTGPVEYKNVHYSMFFEEESETLAQLPKDQLMTVVCAKGGASGAVVELLHSHGFLVRHLDGGMLAWSQLLVPHLVIDDRALQVWQFNRIGKGCLSYVIASQGEAIVVDPARITQAYVQFAQDYRLTIRYVMDTHIHADHISGGARLAEIAGCPYLIAPDVPNMVVSHDPLHDGKVFHLGTIAVESLSIHTPGHTPESTCLLIDGKALISGDTLFVNSLGRPDLGGHSYQWAKDLHHSLTTKLQHVADNVMVLPAHYSGIQEISQEGFVFAPMGVLRQNNQTLLEKSPHEFAEMVSSRVSEPPANFEEIVGINMGKQSVAEDEASELEIGPNRCAMAH